MIKRILISQPEPASGSPYSEITSKHEVQVDFQPFFKVEPISAKEFRTQKINILDYTAMVFTAKSMIDAFFKICEELRIVIPESMKYFCTSEAIALYLQKYIVYRKRKIFFGNGTVDSIVGLVGTKHKAEKFLIASAENANQDLVKNFSKNKLKSGVAIFLKTVNSDLSSINLDDYQLLVFYSPSDIKSLQDNFPNYDYGKLRFATFGSATAKRMKEEKITIEIQAPTPEMPSIAKALELYLGKQ